MPELPNKAERKRATAAVLRQTAASLSLEQDRVWCLEQAVMLEKEADQADIEERESPSN